MKNKPVGLVILLIGFVIMLYAGFDYMKRDKILDLGAVEITVDNEHNTNWFPYVGIGLMAVGGFLYMSGKKK
jgi:LPXTG-motif cell wall-anchored protein